MHMLGFVLKTQWGMIQSKLLIWIFYSMQNSLEHFGTSIVNTMLHRANDVDDFVIYLLGSEFTFQFNWLRS